MKWAPAPSKHTSTTLLEQFFLPLFMCLSYTVSVQYPVQYTNIYIAAVLRERNVSGIRKMDEYEGLALEVDFVFRGG